MRRNPDRELLPHPTFGWRCPRCKRAATTFYGIAPNRRCIQCFSLERQ